MNVMNQRFILFRRNGTDYCQDTETRQQLSLRTKDEAEARTLLQAGNESFLLVCLPQRRGAVLTVARRMAKTPAAKFQFLARVRIMQGPRIALGPGKAQLLEGVQRHGSISEAARQMKMSYMRAWLHVREMNSSFKNPLVAAKRGSVNKGGGAYLTVTGLRVMALYQKINAKCLRNVRAERNQLQKLLR